MSNLVSQVLFLWTLCVQSVKYKLSVPTWEVNIISCILQIRKPRLRITVQGGTAGVWVWSIQTQSLNSFLFCLITPQLWSPRSTCTCFIKVLCSVSHMPFLTSVWNYFQQPMFLKYRPHKSHPPPLFLLTTEFQMRFGKYKPKL